jgi:hypothetical protein
MYAGFQKHFAEEWCGFNKVEGVKQPVRAAAVVPKFYGYYLPEEVKESMSNAYYWRAPSSPILLLEDCGKQVNPELLTLDQKYVLHCTCNYALTRTRHVRIEMYSLFCRLHQVKIAQRSAALRNMVMQPGPLTVPPHKRSMAHASFRVIDFGSGRIRDNCDSEKNQARSELMLDAMPTKTFKYLFD